MRRFTILLLTVIITSCASNRSFDQENLKTLIADQNVNAGNTTKTALLKQKLAGDDLIEKDAALYAVEDDNIIELVPAVLDAITDMTPAPRYGDTGWGYIGRHAGWVICGIIRKNDSAWFAANDLGKDRALMDFLNNDDRQHVKDVLQAWWNDFKKNRYPAKRMDILGPD